MSRQWQATLIKAAKRILIEERRKAAEIWKQRKLDRVARRKRNSGDSELCQSRSADIWDGELWRSHLPDVWDGELWLSLWKGTERMQLIGRSSRAPTMYS